MAVMTGPMTVARFRVVGALPRGWRDDFRDRLNESAFRERLPGGGARAGEAMGGAGKEEIEGWVQVHNLLETSFDDYNKWLYNDVALFALRVDRKRLPAKLFRATLERRCQAWCAEREVERVPSAVRQELKTQLEEEWLARTLPTVTVVDAAWHLDRGWFVISSLSETMADRFRKRFLRTFGLKLAPWSPLDFVGDPSTIDALLSCAPTRMPLGVHLAENAGGRP